MAMKLSAAEKQNDSIIRGYNTQIEKAVKQLGYSNTITQNLINNAKIIFGETNMKQMTKKSVKDIATGETVHIPQISRNRKTLSTNKAKELQKEVKTKSGTYKNMYDVSKYYQNVIDKAIAKKRANIPQKFMEIKNIKDRTKAIKNYVNNVTKSDINEQIVINDLISETFEKYKINKEKGENVDDYIEFANDFHSGKDINIETLMNLKSKQFENTILQNGLSENYESEIGNLSEFIDLIT